MKTLLEPADLESALERIGRIRPDTPRRWGRMSPHGMVCHLTDAFLGCLGDRPIPDHSTLLGRTAMRFVAATVPMPWPRGVATVAEADQEKSGTQPGDFAEDVQKLREVTEAFVSRLDPETMRHPIFGRMSRAQWGRWGYRHIDHHARQFGL